MMDEEKGMIPGLEPEREAAGRRFLLAAVNAKYIHSNPAIYSLKVYAGQELQEYVELAEYTINQPMQDILTDIYMRKPDVVGFSCYIWNIQYVIRLIRNLSKILPDVDIPSFCPKQISGWAGRKPPVTEKSCWSDILSLRAL